MTDSKKAKVLVVDDSAVIRAIIQRTLGQQAMIDVVGVAQNGEEAISATALLKPDIVVLDIEMPVMDGLTALPLILKENPGALVLICSTLSARGADVTLRALSLGAADCLLKPGGESITTARDFQEELVRVVTTLSHGLKSQIGTSLTPPPIIKPSSTNVLPPRVLAIASSTGGPKALTDVLKDLKSLPIPIVITQHMPKSFTALLATNLQQGCGLPCVEGAEGTALKPGTAYIAPGGLHMTFQKAGGETIIRLNNGPAENYCKPSADPMFRSLVETYGGRIQAAILTGMGSDGLEGSRAVVAAGGQVIAQDEATSTVWGMPGAVARAGLCAAVLPLPQISPWLRQAITGRKAA